MRLVFVIDNLGSGGAQRQMTLLATGLADRGHSVDFFTYQPDIDFFCRELAGKDIRVFSQRKAGRFDLAPVFALRKRLHSERYDAAVAFMPTPSIYLAVARGFRSNLPFFISHRIAFVGHRVPANYKIALIVCGMAKGIIANSFRGAAQLKDALPFFRQKIHVILNGVDLHRYNSSAPPFSSVRPNLLFIGRLSRQKNLISLLEAFSILKKRCRQLPLLRWAGRADEGGDAVSYGLLFEQKIQELNLSECWRPLGQRSDIPQLLSESDALILTSTFEGMPNAVCEALAAGRPVLASRVGDIERIVVDGVSGLLSESGEARDLARILETFMKMDRKQRIEMGYAARRSAEEHLSLKRYLDEWEAILLNAANQ